MINTEVEKAAKNDEYECIGVSNEDVIYILNLLRECGYTLKENHSPISTDGSNTWSTVGVSRDIIEASFKALIDSIEYKLLKGDK